MLGKRKYIGIREVFREIRREWLSVVIRAYWDYQIIGNRRWIKGQISGNILVTDW